jgi:hypothetical protein
MGLVGSILVEMFEMRYLGMGSLADMSWEEAVSGLTSQVEGWLAENAGVFGGFGVERFPLDIGPDHELLVATMPNGLRVTLEPARFAIGHIPTAIDLYAYPTLRRVRLVGPIGEAWEVQTSQGVPMNYGWNRADFLHLVAALVDEPVSNRV